MNRWWPRAAAVVGLATFVALERRLRVGEAARSLDRGEHDRGSTLAIGAAFGVAGTGSLLSAATSRGRLPVWTGWLGVGLMAAGIGVRRWSAMSLGAAYTRTLRVGPGQRVVESGPYAVVRHPGYAADLLMWLGYGLAWTSLPAVLVSTLPMLAAYGYRITVEEAMLRAELGDQYVEYSRRTRRLVPGLY